MILGSGVIRLTASARENRHRPAIDPLFRTAAHVYGPRVLGIVLTGMADDGTLGLRIIKAAGGVAIVQDPREAMFASMPQSALNAVAVDYVLHAMDMPAKIIQLATEKWKSEGKTPSKLQQEPTGPEDEKMSEDERVVGKPSVFTCPDCNGTLWEVEDGGLLHFRCRVGHAFSSEAMREGYTDSIEGALWSAVRALQESAALERRLEQQASDRGDQATARRYGDVAQGREEQADLIRDMLLAKASKTS